MVHRVSPRREFLRFLAGSPLAAAVTAQEPAPATASARDALNVMDFEPLARQALPPAHWGYLATGVDDDLTLRMNREAMAHYQLRARRLVDVAKIDLRTEVFGADWDMPIYMSAVSAQRAFHADGELATARAAKARKTTQMLSTRSSTSVEDVAKALGAAPWYQLYMPTSWGDTEKLVRRVEAAGCSVLAWTIDTSGDDRIFPRGFPAGVVKSVRNAQPYKEIYLEPSGLQRGLEDVLILVEGVHMEIPDAPPTNQQVYIGPPAPPAAGPGGAPGAVQPPPAAGPGTAADSLRSQYKAAGDAQGQIGRAHV